MVSLISIPSVPARDSASAWPEGIWLMLAWVAFVGITPLFEEVLLRGFMLPGFSRAGGAGSGHHLDFA